jgi:putative RNA 2'-phosphotransferase
MPSMNYKKLSKQISYALRHAPWKFGLELDEYGWVEVDELLNSLRTRKVWRNLQESDLQAMMSSSDKKRFEISGGKIRALYGHSIHRQVVKEPRIPPEVLYHGTARRFLSSIMEKGLLPRGRQYVHLSTDVETAMEVGRRHDHRPVILHIAAGKAHEEGIDFYQGNHQVWLVEHIDPKYLRRA